VVVRKAADSRVRIQVASDLHFEFYVLDGRMPPSVAEILTPSAPVLALLGDISLLAHAECAKHYEAWLIDCCSHFDRILVLLGNHEYYCEGTSKTNARRIIASFRDMCARVSAQVPSTGATRVVPLENDAVTIDGVRILGTTLWSKIHPLQTVEGAQAANADPLETVEYRMQDFRRIYEGSGDQCTLVSIDEINRWHSAGVARIEQEARDCTASKQPLVILTHHAPSFRTCKPVHAPGAHPSGFGCAFATDLERFLTRDGEFASIHSWAFGHSHYNVDMCIGKVRVVSNQRGYDKQLSENYRSNFVLEVPLGWPLTDPVSFPRPVDRPGKCFCAVA